MAPRTSDAIGGSAPPVDGADERLASGDVERATRAELEALGVESEVSALGATALEMARQLDSRRNSATAKSMCAGRLAEALDRLRELYPPAEEDSPLDQLRQRRDARVAEAASRVGTGG